MDWTSLGNWFTEQGYWVVITLAVAVVAFWALRRWAPRFVSGIARKMQPGTLREELEERCRLISRALVTVGSLVIVASAVLIILHIAGVDLSGPLSTLAGGGRAIGLWLGSHGVRILIIGVLAIIAHELSKRTIPHALEHAIALRDKERTPAAVEARVRTLSRFLSGAAALAIWTVAGFMILSEIGVDIGPLLAGAGVMGIAIGFGAQSLIKDIISGFFIITENQYGVGDVVRVGDIAGLVEDVTVRRTILRDLDGIVHVVPNGEIRVSSNFTKEWSRVNINISVSYGEDLDYVIAVINRVGQEVAQDENWAPVIIGAPRVLRVDNFGDSGIELKVLAETQPLKQWDVMGELRRRIKRAFDEAGIEIPFPHRTLVYKGRIRSEPPYMDKLRAERPGKKDALPSDGPAALPDEDD